MKDTFIEAATQIDIPSVRQWRETGKKVVGYTCSFLPVEVFYAADILPVRLRGINASGMEIGDTYYGPFICTFPKTLLQLVGKGAYRFLDGAVISTGCDAMRRLDECWRKAGDDITGIVPGFFHYLDVPHKPDEHALKWFVGEIRELIARIEAHFKVEISEDRLRGAIRRQNEIRRLLRELEEFRSAEPVKISGTDAFAAVIAGTVMPREVFAQCLEQTLEALRRADAAPLARGKRRLMLIGSINDDIDLVKIIEDAGAHVVADNICFGVRTEADQVREEGDPVTALAERYLSRSVCPRMFGGYQTRLRVLTAKIKRAGVEGVIMQNVRFCDLHGSENGLLERDLDKMGIPSIRIEREYGPLTETGRMKLRIHAFLESMGD